RSGSAAPPRILAGESCTVTTLSGSCDVSVGHPPWRAVWRSARFRGWSVAVWRGHIGSLPRALEATQAARPFGPNAKATPPLCWQASAGLMRRDAGHDGYFV